jgi:hypothetical protein
MFYGALLDGSTIRDAFTSAKNLIHVCRDNISCCCCAHDHEENCWWKEYSIKNRIKAHEKHFQKCQCDLRSTKEHKPGCPAWIQFKNLKKELVPNADLKSRIICCCRPHEDHSEGMKFKMIYSKDAEAIIDEPLFDE